MLNLLTGLNNVQLWSQELGSDVSVVSGMFVTITEGKAALPTVKGDGPCYLVFGSSDVPSVEGSNKIALIYGICRIETDQYVAEDGGGPVVYSAGDALTVNTDGKLIPAVAGDFVVGVVEAVEAGSLRVALSPAVSFA